MTSNFGNARSANDFRASYDQNRSHGKGAQGQKRDKHTAYKQIETQKQKAFDRALYGDAELLREWKQLGEHWVECTKFEKRGTRGSHKIPEWIHQMHLEEVAANWMGHPKYMTKHCVDCGHMRKVGTDTWRSPDGDFHCRDIIGAGKQSGFYSCETEWWKDTARPGHRFSLQAKETHDTYRQGARAAKVCALSENPELMTPEQTLEIWAEVSIDYEDGDCPEDWIARRWVQKFDPVSQDPFVEHPGPEPTKRPFGQQWTEEFADYVCRVCDEWGHLQSDCWYEKVSIAYELRSGGGKRSWMSRCSSSVR